jgi:chromosome segregation ATPase
MAESNNNEVALEILTQLREEIRAMRASLETGIDSLRTQVDFLQRRIEHFEVKLDSLDERNETRIQDLFHRFGVLDSDLKKFASVANEAILHYAGEMDSVRDRVLYIESKLGIPYPND